jgi:sugar/nucleoside kinase (ribokinase family)
MKRRAPLDADAGGAPLDVLCLGEALWDLAAPRGRTFATAPSLRFQPGGAAVNVALALAERGWTAGLAATVGADALGEALVARVSARGVDTTLVERAPPRTGLVFMEQPGPSPRVVGYRHADEAVPELHASWRARVLVLTGILPAATAAERFAAAARAARRRETVVVVDLNARPRVWREHATAPPSRPPAWLADADVVKASKDDLRAMDLDPVVLRTVLRPSAVLVVTAGPRAAHAFGPFGEAVHHPDSLSGPSMGAGDAFVAALCDALLTRAAGTAADDAFWERTLRRAHAAARRRLRPSRISGG